MNPDRVRTRSSKIKQFFSSTFNLDDHNYPTKSIYALYLYHGQLSSSKIIPQSHNPDAVFAECSIDLKPPDLAKRAIGPKIWHSKIR